MQQSASRILTTHAGSLPRPADLLDTLLAREQGQPVDEAAYGARLPGAVQEIVSKQVELGIDIVDDGEYSKPSFVTYVNERLGGFEPDADTPNRSPWAGSREAHRISRILRGRPRRLAAAPHGLHRARHLQGPRAAPARHRQSQGGDEDGGRERGIHAFDLAVERRGVAAQRLLQEAGGLHRRDRRRDARGIQGDRRCRPAAADRRPPARLTLSSEPERRASPTAASGRTSASRCSTTRCAASRKRKSATTPATASTWVRASTTWR